MNWKWQKIVFSLIAEIILNFVGYDQIADYTQQPRSKDTGRSERKPFSPS
ncbi:hypothetical protein [Chroococcidiopsis sp.]